MPLDPALLEGLDEDKAKAISEAFGKVEADLDTLKGAAAQHEKALKAAQRDAAKWKADLDAASKGQDEAVKALAAERDKLAADLAAAQGEYKTYRIRQALGDKLGITDPARKADALALFGLPEGVDLDESGALIGADKHVEAFKQARPYLFDAPKPGHGGGSPGAEPKPKAGANTDPKLAAREAGRAAGQAVLGQIQNLN